VQLSSLNASKVVDTFCRGLPAYEKSVFGLGVFFGGFFLSSSFFFSKAAVFSSGSSGF